MGYKKYTNKRTVLKKWAVNLIISIILILLGIGSFSIITSLNFKKVEENILYQSNIQTSIDYNVTLKENDLFDEKEMNKGEVYPSLFTDKIKPKFNYTYDSATLYPLTYEYNITATIVGDYKLNDDSDTSKLWTKRFTLIPTKTASINEKKSFFINEEFEIDYDYYDKQASEFKKTLKIPATTKLNVTMSVLIKTYVEGNLIQDEKEITMVIPLTQEAFKIEEKLIKEDSIVEKRILNDEKITSVKKFYAGIVILIIDLIILSLFFKDIFNIEKINNYLYKLKKILKDYGDVIVEVNNPVDESGLDVISVKSFKEMIDLQEELRLPVMFYETIYKLEGEFSVVHGNIIYKYILTNRK